MGSFKLKLVSYFVVLALLPLGAAFWGFHAVLSRSASERVDARLEAGLRAAPTAYQDEGLAARRRAPRPAKDPGPPHAPPEGGHPPLPRPPRARPAPPRPPPG